MVYTKFALKIIVWERGRKALSPPPPPLGFWWSCQLCIKKKQLKIKLAYTKNKNKNRIFPFFIKAFKKIFVTKIDLIKKNYAKRSNRKNRKYWKKREGEI